CPLRPILEQLGDASLVVDGNEDAARPLEDVAEPLAGKAYGGRVDERLDLIDVVAQHAKEQRLVAIVQRVERHVFFKVVRQAAQVLHHALCLLLERKQVRRQEAAQAQRVALLLAERGAFVKERIAQQGNAARKAVAASSAADLRKRAHCIFLPFKR